MLVVQRAAYFRGEAVPEMVHVGHGLKQFDIGLLAQFDIALDFKKDLLLKFAYGALAVQNSRRKAASKRKNQRRQRGGSTSGGLRDGRRP